MTKELRTDAADIKEYVAYFVANRPAIDAHLTAAAAKQGLAFAGSPTADLSIMMQIAEKEADAAIAGADQHESEDNKTAEVGQTVEGARRHLRTTVADVKTGLSRVYGTARLRAVFGPGPTPTAVEALEAYAGGAVPNLADWKSWTPKGKSALTFDGDKMMSALSDALSGVTSARAARAQHTGKRDGLLVTRDAAATALHDRRIGGAKLLVGAFAFIGDAARADHVMTHHHASAVAAPDAPPTPAPAPAPADDKK